MKEPKNVVEILRHARHDWLNQLQLIKGNLDLGKTNRAKEIIDEIIIDARNESNLSNLGLDDFSSLLLTCNWMQHFFRLEYEVLVTKGTFPLEDQEITAWMNKLFLYLEDSFDPKAENHVFISIEVATEWTRLLFEVRGEFLPNSNIVTYIHKHPLKNGTVDLIEEMEGELAFAIMISE
ncbi:stage 0 sporulation protein B (sporulation initiation phosphotransferase) [Bacillus oleivorans]|uniref:Stage 0 sporulation protein B (Sporulation initiation phosphotransferase) n=1 Tax=Bacillus oleivorans TaxID=1448271 RepID=A0A285CW10_9BACI|nr:Spo0B domain-containing protein [Bacillus oleivorans]SNX71595.1 stage 0 sporulation protein B (sporulation initiation phosphotransferase) [Bacillus oleivorans]